MSPLGFPVAPPKYNGMSPEQVVSTAEERPVSPRKRPSSMRQQQHEPLQSPLGSTPTYHSLWQWEPDHRYTQCIAPLCANEASQYYKSPLCQEHILGIWLMVDKDMRRSGVDPDGIRENATDVRTQRAKETQAKMPGSVYYLRIDGYIKIGHSKDLYQRIGQYPPNAELLAHNPGSRDDERRIHKKFAAFLASGREWFRDVPEIREHIDKQIEKHGPPQIKVARLNAEKKPPLRPKPLGKGRG